MRRPAVLLLRLTALLLLSVLLLVGVPRIAQGVQARSSPGAMSTAYPHGASAPPRSETGPVQRRPGPYVRMRAVDYADRHLQYRVVGELVQRSTDGGRQWATILTPGTSESLRTSGCHPARYSTVSALVVSGLLPGTLFVATGGDPGRMPRTGHDVTCAAATGGLFVLRPDGHGGLRSSGSQAAGLPYAQDAQSRTPRAYTLRDLVTDPTNPNVLYADAIVPAAPASPPAGLYRSSNGGRSWRPALAGLPRTGRGAPAPPGRLLVDPAHGALVFDVIGATLYRSVNGGASWTAVRALPARHMLHLFLNPANPRLVYALTDRGLYHSRDAGATWTRLTGRRLPALGRIRTLTFDVREPASVSVMPWRGRPLRLAEPHAPAPPHFDLALALTPQRYDRVVVALHTAPLARARLTVVGGANRTSAHLLADAAGFGYANVHLTGPVLPAALRVRVQIGRRTQTLTPWLPPGWAPGQAPRPRPTATPIPTATATSAPTATPTPIPTAIPSLSPPAPASSTPTDAPAATPTPLLPTPTNTPPPPTSDHAIKTVFLIVMENHNWSDIKGNPSAPYINNTLLPMASYAGQYYEPPANNSSLPNYLWLEAGTNFGITDDNPPSSHLLTTTTHLVSLLSAAGISWKAYEESISGTRCPLTNSYPYAVRHDPFVYFTDVTNNLSSNSAYCLAHVRPSTELATDLATNTVARYNFITPNLCDDMHDTCSPTNDAIKQGDSWLANNVAAILSSQAYKNGGALFITWDEGANGRHGPIGMIVLSADARGHGYSNAVYYTHSSLLRTLEEIFGVGPWLGDAANATDLRDLFSTFP